MECNCYSISIGLYNAAKNLCNERGMTMSIYLLARRNLSGHLQRYAAYFFSCVFSVTIFFIYAQFIYHPDVTGGTIPAGEAVRQGMIAAQVIIIIFSFFFLSPIQIQPF